MFLPTRLVKHARDLTRLSAAGVRAAFGEGRLRLTTARPATRAPTLDDLVFEDDVVSLDGVRLSPRLQHAHTLLHKPPATLSAPHDPRGKGDLSPWLEAMPPGVFPVGRLDRDTTGALLFTTDGDLANGLLRPERHAHKIYRLQLARPLADDDPRLEAMRAGVDVGPYVARTERVEIVRQARSGAPSPPSAELQVTLSQGRHRQIRRTCRTLGLRLVHLHRVRVGPVDVSALPEGRWRSLTPPEVEALWEATGGRARLARAKLQALERRARRVRALGSPDLRLEGWLQTQA